MGPDLKDGPLTRAGRRWALPVHLALVVVLAAGPAWIARGLISFWTPDPLCERLACDGAVGGADVIAFRILVAWLAAWILILAVQVGLATRGRSWVAAAALAVIEAGWALLASVGLGIVTVSALGRSLDPVRAFGLAVLIGGAAASTLGAAEARARRAAQRAPPATGATDPADDRTPEARRTSPSP